MSRSLFDLKFEFHAMVAPLLDTCRSHGYDMRPYDTLRSVDDQAKLWRQGRSSQEIRQTIKTLEREGAPWIADRLQAVGPQHGRKVTFALPGQSWHNWGLAVDCYRRIASGHADWSKESYRFYADLAREMGMTAGFYFRGWNDAPHIQMPSLSKPGMSWSEINEAMEGMFA